MSEPTNQSTTPTIESRKAEGRCAPATCSADDPSSVLKEHREMYYLLMQAVDAMAITQRLFKLSDGHILMSKCIEIERWLDAHQ